MTKTNPKAKALEEFLKAYFVNRNIPRAKKALRALEGLK
jgi:hypothetical protein